MNYKKYDKKFYVEAFFRDFRKRVENIKKIIGLGFKEEGAILALCQVDALSNFRYNPKRGEQQKCFEKLLKQYSNITKSSAHAKKLYKHFRCQGVHFGRIPYSLQTYTGKNPVFSLDGVLSILENCLVKIEQQCIDNNKWPHEL